MIHCMVITKRGLQAWSHTSKYLHKKQTSHHSMELQWSLCWYAESLVFVLVLHQGYCVSFSPKTCPFPPREGMGSRVHMLASAIFPFLGCRLLTVSFGLQLQEQRELLQCENRLQRGQPYSYSEHNKQFHFFRQEAKSLVASPLHVASDLPLQSQQLYHFL